DSPAHNPVVIHQAAPDSDAERIRGPDRRPTTRKHLTRTKEQCLLYLSTFVLAEGDFRRVNTSHSFLDLACTSLLAGPAGQRRRLQPRTVGVLSNRILLREPPALGRP